MKYLGALLLILSLYTSNSSAKELSLSICGLNGDIEARKTDCIGKNNQAASQYNWNLVMVDSNFRRYWQDSTGVIWGPRLATKGVFIEALLQCSADKSGLVNRLPSTSDFSRVMYTAPRLFFPDWVYDNFEMELFWTVSAIKRDVPFLVLYDAQQVSFQSVPFELTETLAFNIRCVGQ